MADKGEHDVDGRGRDAEEATELLNGGDEGIDLHRPAALEILQHRGLVGADLAGTFDAAVDVDREPDAELLADRLGLDHHGAGDGAGAGILDDLDKRAAGQRRDRVEGEVAPQLDPDVAADIGADRGLEAGGDKCLRDRLDAIGALAGRLAEREAVALDMVDDTRLRHVGGRVDDAADGALGADPLPDAAAGIDGFDAGALERTAGLVEIPPRDAVLGGDDGGIGTEQRRDGVERRRDRVRLEAEDDAVLRAKLRGVGGGADEVNRLVAVLDQAQAVGADRREMGAAGDQRQVEASTAASFAAT